MCAIIIKTAPLQKQKGMKNIFWNLLLLIFASLLSSCSNKEVIHFYSMDKENCITVLTEDTIRYVIAGRTSEIPDTNYIKLDIGRIDELGDGVWICWLENNKWDIVIHNSRIIENKLDGSKYFFNTQLPKNEIGAPTEKKFRRENCAVFSYSLMRLTPDKGAIVEIE